MGPLGGIALGIIGIGVVAVTLPLLAASIYLWWIAIPLLCAWAAGGIGLFFGIGLDVILAGLFAVIGVVKKDLSAIIRAQDSKRPTWRPH